MDDLTQQLQQILADPQSMQQIQQMMGSLNLGGDAAPAQQPTPPQAAPVLSPAPPAQNNLLGALGGITPEALQTMTKLAPLLQQTRQEDDATRLLRALRPMLSEPRQGKLDEAIKILQMMRLLPLLRESGLLSGMFSGLL